MTTSTGEETGATGGHAATHHDVFVCHASEDKTIADAVVATLEQGGVRCWIAPRDVTPGESWAVDILRAIRGATVVVFLLSSHSNSSPHVSRELERAVNEGLAVLPFRIEDVLPSAEIEYFVSSAHWLDAMSPPLQAHLDRLLETVRFLVAERRGEPGPAATRPGPATPAAPQPAPTGRGPLPRAAIVAAAVVVAALCLLGVVLLVRNPPSSKVASTTTSAAPTTAAPSTVPPKVVATFEGSKDQTTKSFVVGSPWRISWSIHASTTPLVTVYDAEGNIIDIIGDIGERDGSKVEEQPCTCRLEISVYGATTYTFTVTDGG